MAILKPIGAESSLALLLEPSSGFVHGAAIAAALRTEEDGVFGGVAAFQGRTCPSHEWLFMDRRLFRVHPATEIAPLQRTC